MKLFKSAKLFIPSMLLLLAAGIFGAKHSFFEKKDLSGLESYKQETFLNNKEMRLTHFKKDFYQALKKPSAIGRMGEIFVNGLMSHIGYIDALPSFIAFTELHQGLYTYIKEAAKNQEEKYVPKNIYEDFQKASHIFSERVLSLESCNDIDIYAEKIQIFYTNFLEGFMERHKEFFQERFCKNVQKARLNDGYDLDVVDRAFFKLNKEWPAYEEIRWWLNRNPKAFYAKHTFESLVVYPCPNDRILILSYDNHPQSTDHSLRIYMWDWGKKGEKPLRVIAPLTQPLCGLDLSPQPRYGGYPIWADIKSVIYFNGSVLMFYGYDYKVFRHYVYEMEKKQWIITESKYELP